MTADPSKPDQSPPESKDRIPPARDLTVITCHTTADFDALASMLAAKKLYPEAVAVFPGAQEKNLRNFFLQSTIYALDITRVKQVDLDRIQRLVLVDTRQKSRIGKFKEIVDHPEVEIHVYDHHPDSKDDIQGRINLVRTTGANVTLMVDLLQERGITLTEEEATILAVGIYEDTGSFTFASTTPQDFAAAAWLLEQGANLNLVADLITHELTSEQITLLGDLLQAAEYVNFRGVEIVVSRVSTDAYVGDFAVLVHKFMDMENLGVLFALARMEDRIYVVARSRISEVNVGQILSHLGGGGHPTAASATIKDLTLTQVHQKLLMLLESNVRPVRRARTLMSAPVVSVSPEASISEARQTLGHYSLNALPVVDRGRPVGILTRQVMARAARHGLEEQPVADYMDPELSTVSPEATLHEVQQAVIDRRQRLLPVVEEEQVVGVITRTDLLTALVEEPLGAEDLMDRIGPAGEARRRSVLGLMRERLPHWIIELLADLGRAARELGYEAMAVGGFIRDLYLRRRNLDIDVVIEGDGIAFAKAFAREHGIRVVTHDKFNTAVLVFPDKFKIDVATARMEYYESPAALPVVQVSSIKHDLARRDFTINTLAVSLNPERFGTLLDFFFAQRDIKDRVIRVLHNLSFIEDPTRILRAVRFESRFSFRIGKLTEKLIVNAVQMDAVARLDGRRLSGELRHLLEEEQPARCLRRLAEFGVLSAIHPGLEYDDDLDEALGRLGDALAWYELSFLENPIDHWRAYYLVLTHRLVEDERRRLAARLELSPKLSEVLLTGQARAEEAARRLARPRTHLDGENSLDPDRRRYRPASETYRLLSGLAPEFLVYIMAITTRAAVQRSVSTYLTRLRQVRPELTGEDLKALGLTPGPLFSTILDHLLEARLNLEVKTRGDEIDLVKRHYLTEARDHV
jgi:tRNA nucleotidyltransferase (CCA-adding enzyme)